MKKNRRVTKKMNVIAKGTMHIGAVLGVLFVMVIMNVLASSSCQQLLKTIGEDEKILARLDETLARESTRWEQMKTPDRVETALRGHGLMMRPARADQNVSMRGDGTPYPGQTSVAKMRRKAAPVAQVNRKTGGR